MRIGILGGTFNPVHHGHLRLALEVQEELGLDQVFLVLSADPPHKTSGELLSADARWEMLCTACKGVRCLIPSDVEIHRDGPSYTITTLEEFHNLHKGNHDFFLIIGLDCACELKTWWKYERIFDLATVVVAYREGEKWESIPEEIRFKLIKITIPILDISSTRIRKLVYEGRSIRYLVPDGVYKIIIEKGYYHPPTVTGKRQNGWPGYKYRDR